MFNAHKYGVSQEEIILSTEKQIDFIVKRTNYVQIPPHNYIFICGHIFFFFFACYLEHFQYSLLLLPLKGN